MVEEAVERDTITKRKGAFNKRNGGHMKKRKRIDQLKTPGKHGVKKMDSRTKKLFQKRARDYNSDDDDDHVDNVEEELVGSIRVPFHGGKGEGEGEGEGEEEGEEEAAVDEKKDEDEEDEEGAIQPGILRFTEGCNAFRSVFKKIMKRSASDDDVLGPVLSANKKLVAEKLAEDEEGHKVKSEARKEKHLVQEQGHIKPANYLDSHEKFLIGIATKGVVKLFNAVNKAQHAQKGLNPSTFKDEKAIRKRRKEAFFSELGKKSSTPKVVGSSGEGPSWAPLRDNYMLTNPKLKDWDKKKPDKADENDFGRRRQMETDSSSDDE